MSQPTGGGNLRVVKCGGDDREDRPAVVDWESICALGSSSSFVAVVFGVTSRLLAIRPGMGLAGGSPGRTDRQSVLRFCHLGRCLRVRYTTHRVRQRDSLYSAYRRRDSGGGSNNRKGADLWAN